MNEELNGRQSQLYRRLLFKRTSVEMTEWQKRVVLTAHWCSFQACPCDGPL